MRPAFGVLLSLCLLASSGVAKGPTYIDPDQTDEDFVIQGEYAGTLSIGDEKLKLGVQVIALGEGKFEAVGYHGGLPGDGWDQQEEPKRTQGQRNGDVVEFKSDKGSGVIKDGELTVTVEGITIGSLQKVTRSSPTMNQKPPQGAVVLFDGSSPDQWKNGKVEDGLLVQGTTSKPTFGSHKLHIEFRLPYQPQNRGQGRGNSGIYVQGRYEVQMLDSFGLEGKNNECGGLYEIKDPDLNMCLPPLTWQTYDIDYTAAKHEDGKLVANPRMTVTHNGVVIHDDVELPGDRSSRAAPSKPGPEPGPVYLQDHRNPVRYRNIWVVEK